MVTFPGGTSVVPYLVLMREDAEQRRHDLRELFNGLRYVIRYGIALARHAERSAALVGGLSAISSLDGGGLLRSIGV